MFCIPMYEASHASHASAAILELVVGLQIFGGPRNTRLRFEVSRMVPKCVLVLLVIALLIQVGAAPNPA
jgi:energy-converting hydrogenase Eha subunit A